MALLYAVAETIIPQYASPFISQRALALCSVKSHCSASEPTAPLRRDIQEDDSMDPHAERSKNIMCFLTSTFAFTSAVPSSFFHCSALRPLVLVHVARFFAIRAKTAAIYPKTFAGRHARIPPEIQNLIREAARRQGALLYSSNLALPTHLELLH
jgi:hypothetical protein